MNQVKNIKLSYVVKVLHVGHFPMCSERHKYNTQSSACRLVNSNGCAIKQQQPKGSSVGRGP